MTIAAAIAFIWAGNRRRERENQETLAIAARSAQTRLEETWSKVQEVHRLVDRFRNIAIDTPDSPRSASRFECPCVVAWRKVQTERYFLREREPYAQELNGYSNRWPVRVRSIVKDDLFLYSDSASVERFVVGDWFLVLDPDLGPLRPIDLGSFDLQTLESIVLLSEVRRDKVGEYRPQDSLPGAGASALASEFDICIFSLRNEALLAAETIRGEPPSTSPVELYRAKDQDGDEDARRNAAGWLSKYCDVQFPAELLHPKYATNPHWIRPSSEGRFKDREWLKRR